MKAIEPAGFVARCITAPAEIATFDQRLEAEHYLGSTPPVGDFLRQAVERDGQLVGLLVWGAAALKLKHREDWIGWSALQRVSA